MAKKFKCDLCEATFPTEVARNGHRASKHFPRKPRSDKGIPRKTNGDTGLPDDAYAELRAYIDDGGKGYELCNIRIAAQWHSNREHIKNFADCGYTPCFNFLPGDRERYIVDGKVIDEKAEYARRQAISSGPVTDGMNDADPPAQDPREDLRRVVLGESAGRRSAEVNEVVPSTLLQAASQHANLRHEAVFHDCERTVCSIFPYADRKALYEKAVDDLFADRVVSREARLEQVGKLIDKFVLGQATNLTVSRGHIYVDAEKYELYELGTSLNVATRAQRTMHALEQLEK